MKSEYQVEPINVQSGIHLPLYLDHYRIYEKISNFLKDWKGTLSSSFLRNMIISKSTELWSCLKDIDYNRKLVFKCYQFIIGTNFIQCSDQPNQISHYIHYNWLQIGLLHFENITNYYLGYKVPEILSLLKKKESTSSK